MKKIVPFIMLSCALMSVLPACMKQKPKELSASHSIRDLVLIYDGGAHRNYKWNKETLYPYVVYTDSAKQPHWLFDGFLFLEFKDGKGRCYASYYEKTGARKQEWSYLLNNYLRPGNAVCALDDCIEDVAKEIGAPCFKRRVVLCLPEPIPGQKDWGELDGKSLDFDSVQDRIAACKWYIDYAIAKFDSVAPKHLELSGFYWIAEEATNSRTIAKPIGDYIQEKDLGFYWIPYWGSDGNTEWKSLNFEHAYIQPNFFFRDELTSDHIDTACAFARKNNMNVEMEFDERALKKHGRGQRMYDYLHGFQRNGVLDGLDIAYYQGGTAWYDLYKSTEPEDRALYRFMADIIVKRQEAVGEKR